MVIGRSASYVAETDAMDRVASYMPGDIIGTGTPPGVGLGQKPPVYLKPGDTRRLGVEGLGELRHATRAWSR